MSRQSPSDSSPPASLSLTPELSATAIRTRCSDLRNRLIEDGLFHAEPRAEGAPGVLGWRISPEPFYLTPRELQSLRELGPRLLAFYTALNQLYLASVKGRQPEWISRYLDQGKPETVVALGRMNRFRSLLPGVLRPDLILTEDGWMASELDSVPGGIGLTAWMSRYYAGLGFQPVGGPEGMIDGFAAMIRSAAGNDSPTLAIIVSEESRDYRPEMLWLGAQLNARGLKTFVLEPDAVRFSEEGLYLSREGLDIPLHVVYRFFELFDLKNIPKSELILYSARKETTALTPPVKAYLEEKMAFALYHHPALRPYWSQALGGETDAALTRIFPRTWILDPREVPPHAVIPNLTFRGRPVTNWRELFSATQKERHLVLKPSGFSELAWGSRGVSVGHDLPETEWRQGLERALERFPDSPSVLQEFHTGKKVEVRYDDTGEAEPRLMKGRVRLSPYYFVSAGKAELGGVLATICPVDKKLIHGMTEAVMAPCAVIPKE
ncbi:MAG TPA: hypothetical protein VI702_05845 [Nitrospiria bacterium]